jgi:hypothetical protein
MVPVPAVARVTAVPLTFAASVIFPAVVESESVLVAETAAATLSPASVEMLSVPPTADELLMLSMAPLVFVTETLPIAVPVPVVLTARLVAVMFIGPIGLGAAPVPPEVPS